jgi:threonine aldolase
MAGPIDLRSDTVTKPTPAMRRAMAEAEVGDDWYGDDPTVNRLEERCAEVTGKEGAVYVATGTMANQIAVHVFARPGHFVAAETTAHVATTEVSTSAILSGIAFHRMAGERGLLSADQVAAALEPDPYGVEVVDLLEVENTHQVGGGSVLPIDDLRAIRKVAQEAGVPVYMDGARIFNASIASGTPVGDYSAEVDAVMFCLSKGLGAPIGSVLCGSADLVAKARRTKILIGGAWRQAGIMAAAGLIALDEGPKRLAEDHANARRLAEGLAEAAPAAVDTGHVETNIVFADVAAIGLEPFDILHRLSDAGVLVNVVAGKVRFLTHRDVAAGDVERVIPVWRQVLDDARMEGGGREDR